MKISCILIAKKQTFVKNKNFNHLTFSTIVIQIEKTRIIYKHI